MPSARKKPAQHDPLPNWIWMLLGAGLGLLAGFVIYVGFRPRPVRPEPAADAASIHAERATRRPSDAQGAEASKTAGNDEQNRFDFYEVLPRFRVVVPGAQPPAGTAKAPAAAAPPAPGTYVLQVGSFRALEDADRLQARLALLGIESEIEHVAVKDGTWHRVRVGPSNDLTKMDRIRRRLQSAKIASVLMRVD